MSWPERSGPRTAWRLPSDECLVLKQTSVAFPIVIIAPERQEKASQLADLLALRLPSACGELTSQTPTHMAIAGLISFPAALMARDEVLPKANNCG